jgi:hypothetical protein
VPKHVVNDIMIAIPCRDASVAVVTKNDIDFARLRQIVAFDFLPPWPAPDDGR